MNSTQGSKRAVFITALVLIGLAAGVLGMFKARQKLSPPALKLAETPSLDQRGKVVNPVSVALPETVLNYYAVTNLSYVCITDEELGYLPKDTTYGRRFYVRPDGGFMQMSVVLMGTDRTSIHKPEICLDGQGWTRGVPEIVSLPIGRPHRYDLPMMKIGLSRYGKFPDGQEGEQHGVFLYWFVAENRLTASHKERFWHSMKELVTTGVTPRWAYVICYSVCAPGQEAALYERMKEFLAAAVPEFQLVSAPNRSADPPPRTALR